MCLLFLLGLIRPNLCSRLSAVRGVELVTLGVVFCLIGYTAAYQVIRYLCQRQCFHGAACRSPVGRMLVSVLCFFQAACFLFARRGALYSCLSVLHHGGVLTSCLREIHSLDEARIRVCLSVPLLPSKVVD